jgi:hypothetical protein
MTSEKPQRRLPLLLPARYHAPLRPGLQRRGSSPPYPMGILGVEAESLLPAPVSVRQHSSGCQVRAFSGLCRPMGRLSVRPPQHGKPVARH